MKRIDFSDARSDAKYLIGGFSGIMKGRRWLAQTARMKLFLPADEANRLTLVVWYNREQEVSVVLNGTALGTAQVRGTKQTETFAFDVPAGLAKAESVLELRCRNPHPFDAYVARCLEVGSLEIEKWDEPEAAAPKKPEHKLLFGDIHVHSNLSPCGRPNNGSPEENYEWAREDGWDFVALADHDSHMTDEMWARSIEACKKYDDPGAFATLFAYEWTSFHYGQMNVYSPSERLPLYRWTDDAYSSPPRLWKALRALDIPVFTVYHHMAAPGQAATWDYYDPELLPLIEIYSVWRSSETADGIIARGRPKLPGCTARDALARGLKVGFVGGGDTHELRHGTRGVAAVYATECTKEAIFDALRAKRCYATTGARIALEFTIGGIGMGGETIFTPYTQDVVYPAPCRIEVRGTAPIRSVELVDNGEVVFSGGSGFGLREARLDFPIRNLVREHGGASLSTPSHAYYVRVTQEDGHMAWSSPIYFTRDWSGIE